MVHCLCLAVMFSAAVAVGAASVPVRTTSGTDMWMQGGSVSYNHEPTMKVTLGDSIVFKYSSSHDVVLFSSKSHYDDCSFSGGASIGGRNDGGGSGFSYEMETAGTFYFGCSVGSHCATGNQKITIEVETAESEDTGEEEVDEDSESSDGETPDDEDGEEEVDEDGESSDGETPDDEDNDVEGSTGEEVVNEDGDGDDIDSSGSDSPCVGSECVGSLNDGDNDDVDAEEDESKLDGLGLVVLVASTLFMTFSANVY